jgi:hydrogenase maturation protein HypF
MLPYTPLHYLLFYYPEAGGDFRSARATFSSLVMTSGNFAGQPICKDNGEALEKLSSIADAFLLHNRDIHTRCDDSVVYRLEDKQLIARRSRGFAPTPLTLNRTSADDTILAFGGELKSTICVVDGNHAVLSQHIGDVEDGSTMESYRETIRHLSQVFELTPNLYAYDLHPEYLSSKYCLALLDSDDNDDVRAIGVQHHHAHVASVMAEHNLKEPVIGFAMDGTGYGLDSNIWGGEVLLCAPDSFKRMAHLKYVPLPGGDKAIAEPWRMAFSYVKQVYGTEWRSLDLNCLRQVAPDKMELLESALDKQINCTQVSSLGRLFDSVASLLDIGHFAAYEGQAAIQLEKYASLGAGTNSLPYAITTEESDFNESESWSVGREEPSVLDALSIGEESYLLDYTDTIRAVIDMASRKKETSMVSAAFHDTVVESFLEVAIRLRDKTDVNTVALSGGCWQNRILCERFTRGLTNIGFRVFTNELVPSNDGGLSLGQAFVAANSGQKS